MVELAHSIHWLASARCFRSAGASVPMPYSAARYRIMAWLSHRTKPSSSITGTNRFGLSLANSGVSSPPKGPPASMRWWGTPNSPTVHMTFWTLIDVLRPQTFNIGDAPRHTDTRPAVALLTLAAERPTRA